MKRKALSDWEVQSDNAFYYERTRKNLYELNLVLCNNITIDDCPLEIFHSYVEDYHIKKQNIKLIKVMELDIITRQIKKEIVELKR